MGENCTSTRSAAVKHRIPPIVAENTFTKSSLRTAMAATVTRTQAIIAVCTQNCTTLHTHYDKQAGTYKMKPAYLFSWGALFILLLGFVSAFMPNQSMAQCTPPTVTASTSRSAICSADGSTVTLTGEGADFYVWQPSVSISGSNFGSTVVAAPFETTDYTVTGIRNGCSATAVVRVVVNPSPVISVNPNAASRCTAGPGINLTATGIGSGPYTWAPATGLSATTGSTVTATPATTTTYTVTGATGDCSASSTVRITVFNSPNLQVDRSEVTLCNGEAGTVVASGAMFYAWQPSTGLSSTTAAIVTVNPSQNTTYSVTGLSNGCAVTKTVTVTISQRPVVTITPALPSICDGECVTLTASGSNNYRWAWTPDSTFNIADTNRAAIRVCPRVTKTYTVVAGTGSCQTTSTVQVTVNPRPTFTISPSAPAICSGENVILQATGGAEQYVWQGSPSTTPNVGSTVIANPLVTTTYTVRGTNGSGCTSDQTVTVTAHPLPVITVTPNTDTVCAGTCITLRATGAATYAWSGQDINGPTTGNSIQVCPQVTRTYSVSGIDAQGCTSIRTVTIVANEPLIIEPTPPNPTICRGDSALIAIAGADSFLWTPTQGVVFLNARRDSVWVKPTVTTTYSVEGRRNRCIGQKNITVTVSDPRTITATPNTATICAGSSGQLVVMTGASVYEWKDENGNPAPGVTCLNAACDSARLAPARNQAYVITGTSGGCSNTTTVNITVNDVPSVNLLPTNPSICPGASIALTAGGAATYVWIQPPGTGANDTISRASAVTVSPAQTTTYTVIGTSNGCSRTNTITVRVDQGSNPTIVVTPSAPTVCPGGTATLTATGASTFIWSPSSGIIGDTTGNTIIARPTGTTTYTVSGASGGCTGTTTVTVRVNVNLNVDIAPASAAICPGGCVDLRASGATTYRWAPATGLNRTDSSFVRACPTQTTTYIVEGTTSGCTSTDTIVVTVTSPPTVSASPALPVICQGGSGVTVTGAGADTYTWAVQGGGSAGIISTAGATAVLNPNATTTYVVRGIRGGCSDSTTVTVTVVNRPVVTVAPASPTICAGTSVVLTASGASTYTWEPAGIFQPTNTGASVRANPSTTTTVTVTGSSGTCTGTATFVITVNQPLTITTTPDSAAHCIGSCTRVVASANRIVEYTWRPGNLTGATQNLCPTTTTTYTITGTDGVCSATKTFTLKVNPLPDFAISPANPVICLGLQGVRLNAYEVNNNPAPITWSWSVVQGEANSLSSTNVQNPMATPSETTRYRVVGIQNGCVDTAEVTVRVSETQLMVDLAVAGRDSICLGDSVKVTVSGASTYTWFSQPANILSTDTGTEVWVKPNAAGNAKIIVVGRGGSCVGRDTIDINVAPIPELTLNATRRTICIGDTTVLTVAGALTYTWSPSAGLSGTTGDRVRAFPTDTTMYRVTAVGENGCIARDSIKINVRPAPVTTITPDRDTICLGDAVVLTAGGATTYNWFPATLGTASVIIDRPTTTTEYILEGTRDGCTTRSTRVVTVITPPTLIVVPDSTTICAGKSVTLTATGATTYTWMPGALRGASVTVNPSESTRYTVTGVRNGCAATATVKVDVVQPPSIRVSPPNANICAGATVVLTATGGDTYEWSSEPTGAIISSPSGESVIASPTRTSVIKVVGLANGCTDTATVTITVDPAPNVTLSAPPANLCEGDAVTLTATGAETYFWPDFNLSTTSVSFTATTVREVCVIGITGNCTKRVCQTINPLPRRNITVLPTAITICKGQSALLTAFGGAQYSWSSGATGATAVVTPNATTTYTVTETSGGCKVTATALVTVTDLTSLAVTPPAGAICPSSGQNSVTLTASGASGGYVWLLPGGVTFRGPSYTASPSENTTYSLIGYQDGCQDTIEVPVTVGFNVQITPRTPSVCAGSPVTLKVTGGVSYTWTASDNVSWTATGDSVVVNPIQNTTYTVVSTQGACSGRDSVLVTVGRITEAAIAGLNTSYCASSSCINVTAIPFGGVLSGTGVSNGRFCPQVAGPGTHRITYTGVDNGCQYTTFRDVVVTAPPTPSIAGLNSVYCITDAPVQLTGFPAGGTFSGPGISGNTFTPLAAGEGRRTITYSGATGGCTYSRTTDVIINACGGSALVVTPTNPAICPGSAVVLSAAGGNGTFSWAPATGLSATSGALVAASPTATTTYTITSGNATTTVTVSVGAPTLSTSFTNPNNSACNNGSIVATVTGGVQPYSFALNGGTFVSNSTFTNLSTGQYSLTVKDANGCSATRTVLLSCVPTNTNLRVTPSSPTICANATSGVSLSVTGGTTYTWTPAAGLNRTTGATVTAKPTATTTYTVRSGNDSTVVTVRVAAINVAVTPANPTNSACNNGSISVSASGDGAPFSYQLNSGSYGSASTFTNLGAGTYTVRVRNSTGCIETSTVTLTCQGAAACTLPEFTLTPTGSGVVVTWATAPSTARQYQFQWRVAGSNATWVRQTVTPGSTRSFTIRDLQSGVRYEMRVRINCLPAGNNSPLSDLMFFTTISARMTDAPTQAVSAITLYPNPARTNVTLDIEATEAQSAALSLVDITGRVVLSQRIELQNGLNRELIPLEGITRGVYIVKVQHKTGLATIKLLVE